MEDKIEITDKRLNDLEEQTKDKFTKMLIKKLKNLYQQNYQILYCKSSMQKNIYPEKLKNLEKDMRENQTH